VVVVTVVSRWVAPPCGFGALLLAAAAGSVTDSVRSVVVCVLAQPSKPVISMRVRRFHPKRGA
jgi:hypothetical protein